VRALQEHRPLPEVLPREKKMDGNWCRLFGMSSLKEGAIYWSSGEYENKHKIITKMF
jgi:hypothetical protein